MATRIVKHTDLKVYQRARAAARQVFELSKKFPKEERYSLTDQIRRCSRSVCGNMAEARRKRRYPNAFVSKLNDCEGEAAETQVWLEFAVDAKYIDRDAARQLYRDYDEVISMLVAMASHPEKWTV
jgi:four helix bundle protein